MQAFLGNEPPREGYLYNNIIVIFTHAVATATLHCTRDTPAATTWPPMGALNFTPNNLLLFIPNNEEDCIAPHTSYLVSSKGTFFNLTQLQYPKSTTTIPTLQGYFSKRKLALQKQVVNPSYNNRDHESIWKLRNTNSGLMCLLGHKPMCKMKKNSPKSDCW